MWCSCDASARVQVMGAGRALARVGGAQATAR